MSARHPKWGTPEHAARVHKGSSEVRLAVEFENSREGKRLLRQRGNKKLFAQPRRLIAGPIHWTGKWSLEDLKHIRMIKGVGRPPAARFTPDPVMGVLERWGF